MINVDKRQYILYPFILRYDLFQSSTTNKNLWLYMYFSDNDFINQSSSSVVAFEEGKRRSIGNSLHDPLIPEVTGHFP
jgi:hypothetical protein